MADDFDQYKSKPKAADDWDQYKTPPPYTPPMQQAPSALKQAVMGPLSAIGNMATSIPSNMAGTVSHGTEFAARHPVISAIAPIAPMAYGAYKTAYEEPRKQAIQSIEARPDLYGPNAPHSVGVAKGIASLPLVGPMEIAAEQKAAGNPATGEPPKPIEAATELGTYALAPEIAERVGPPIIRGTAQVANKVLPHAGGLFGTMVGGALGHPWMGYAAGKDVLKGVTIPGERFGLPEEIPPQPAGLFTHNVKGAEAFNPAGAGTIPAGGAVATTRPEAVPIRMAQSQGGIVSKGTTAAPVKTEPMSGGGQLIPPSGMVSGTRVGAIQPVRMVPTPEQMTAAPTENEVAQGMGFKSAQQAVQRLGPMQWQETYGKVVNAPETPTSKIGPIGRPTLFEEPPTERLPDPTRRRLTPEQADRFRRQQEDAEYHEMEAAHEEGYRNAQQLAQAQGNVVGGTKGDILMRSRGVAAPSNYQEAVAGRPFQEVGGIENRTLGNPMRGGQGRVDYVTGKEIPSEYEAVPRPGKLPILRKVKPR